MSACKSCEAPITWVTTEAGKNHPLDEKPDPKGLWVVVHGGGESVMRRATDEDRKLLRPTYTSHFATCPDAAQHRGKR